MFKAKINLIGGRACVATVCDGTSFDLVSCPCPQFVFFEKKLNFFGSKWKAKPLRMTRKGRKHKRGERGSLDEDLTKTKHANMAAVPEETEGLLNVNDEPSLSELREMLVDIQITVNNILLENRKLSDDVAELKAEVKRQKDYIATLKQSLQKTTNHCKEVERELDAARQVIDQQQ